MMFNYVVLSRPDNRMKMKDVATQPVDWDTNINTHRCVFATKFQHVLAERRSLSDSKCWNGGKKWVNHWALKRYTIDSPVDMRLNP